MQQQHDPIFRVYSKKHPVLVFCLLTFSVTWGLRLLYALVRGNGPPLFFNFSLFAQFGPFIAAVIIIGLTEKGDKGFKRIVSLLMIKRKHLLWLLVAALFEPVIFGLITLMFKLNGGKFQIPWGSSHVTVVASYAGTFVWGLFFWGLSEEVGWRGWLLPKLQNRFSPLVATVVMAFITTLWHLNPRSPGDLYTFREGVHIAGLYSPMLEQFVISVPILMVITYIFNRTGGNLMIQMVFHSASNTAYFWVKGVFGIVHTPFFRAGFLLCFWIAGIIFACLLLKQKEKVTWTAETERVDV